MSKRVLAIVIVGLVVLSAYLVYTGLDHAVSLDHAGAARRSLEEDRSVLRKLVVDFGKGTRRADVTALLSASYNAHIVKEEGDIVFIDGVGLRFRDDRLVDVVFMDNADVAEGGVRPR